MMKLFVIDGAVKLTEFVKNSTGGIKNYGPLVKCHKKTIRW
jgi:hypothetical protein